MFVLRLLRWVFLAAFLICLGGEILASQLDDPAEKMKFGILWWGIFGGAGLVVAVQVSIWCLDCRHYRDAIQRCLKYPLQKPITQGQLPRYFRFLHLKWHRTLGSGVGPGRSRSAKRVPQMLWNSRGTVLSRTKLLALARVFVFVRVLGIGPRASVLSGQRSTTELHARLIRKYNRKYAIIPV